MKLSTIIAGLMLSSAPLMCPGLARAHHSFAMFDSTRLVVLHGTLLSFTYLSPHSWISVEVPPGTGVPDGRWDVEGHSPEGLTAMGISRDSFKRGDKLTIGIRPLKDNRRGGSLVFLVDASGKVYGAKPEDLGLKSAELKPR